MRYRQLGASELQVPVISLGSWLTYSGGVEKRQSLACVHKALDLGINLFDTANVYGRGAAESVLGEALAGIPRHSYMLATKVFGAMSDTDRGLSRAQIVKQLDASLKRLRTDYVDLYQCHRFDHSPRGNDGGFDWGSPSRQDPLCGLQRMAARQDRGGGGSWGRFASPCSMGRPTGTIAMSQSNPWRHSGDMIYFLGVFLARFVTNLLSSINVA